MDKEILDQITALIDETSNIIVCSLDEDGFPNAKAMFKTEHEGLKTFLFSTNTSSRRVEDFRRDPRASIYFLGQGKINGLMLVGHMQVCRDRELRVRLWADGCEQYYPLGIDDPDYCVLKFVAEKGNYYNSLKKHLFEIE
jgi:pyridoxamine 5'-phosphate oxidase